MTGVLAMGPATLLSLRYVQRWFSPSLKNCVLFRLASALTFLTNFSSVQKN